ncbi:hypothetical protein K488DRAFT_70908 [Vararia minispora EC-137]|uniref:Uncharacterized protein n=1 Tax=Vararia minispora EC-137 TaxID=1314806 RepID=A0ACB8QJT1_9AGAM|nr:hypothetical protein K488DRAFT_70908 [Vararia minispora EC-137]
MLSSLRIIFPTNVALPSSLLRQSDANASLELPVSKDTDGDQFSGLSSPTELSPEVLTELCSFEEDERVFLESPVIQTYFPAQSNKTPSNKALSAIFEEEEDEDEPSVYSEASFLPTEDSLSDSVASISTSGNVPVPPDFIFAPDTNGVIIPPSNLSNVPSIILIPPPEGDVDIPPRPYVDCDTNWTLLLPHPSLLSAPALSIGGHVLDPSEYEVVQSPVCPSQAMEGTLLYDTDSLAPSDVDERVSHSLDGHQDAGDRRTLMRPQSRLDTFGDDDEEEPEEEPEPEPAPADSQTQRALWPWLWADALDDGHQIKPPMPSNYANDEWEEVSTPFSGGEAGDSDDEDYVIVGDEDIESLLEDVEALEKAPLLGHAPSKFRLFGRVRWFGRW